MNKLTPLALAFTMSSMSTAVAAETFSYTYISAEYENLTEEVDGISEDLEGDGISLGFSVNVVPNFAIIGAYGKLSADVTSGGSTLDIDMNIGSIGGLFHTPINETTDFIAGIELIRGSLDLELNGNALPDEDSDGHALFAGIRAMVSDKVELTGILFRVDIEDDSTTTVSLGGSYYIEKLFSLDAGYSFNSDGDSLTLGVTKYF